CCEKTLEVMRNSQDVLLTILEVLLHDPLYEWSVPAGKSTQKNNTLSNSQNEVNTLAERALMRLQQKLQGLEEGVAMSTEGQVNLLIQQARDPNNLCRIYAGWQPYL
ncbi:serine-protein kinase ATM, partial [Nephila pilipes]